MKIQRFNERGLNTTIYVVTIDDDIYAFTTEMLAADYLIKRVNQFITDNKSYTPYQWRGTDKKEFEPFYDTDGSRFFLTIDENEDYELCLEFLCDHDFKFNIDETTLYNTQKKL